MAKNHKRLRTIIVSHVHTTELREQEIGQAIMNTLAHTLDGETDGVTIAFGPDIDDEEGW